MALPTYSVPASTILQPTSAPAGLSESAASAGHYTIKLAERGYSEACGTYGQGATAEHWQGGYRGATVSSGREDNATAVVCVQVAHDLVLLRVRYMLRHLRSHSKRAG